MRTTDNSLTTEHLGLALYGDFSVVVKVRDMYDWALRLFKEFGANPGFATADIEGKSQKKYKMFKTIDSALKRTDFTNASYFQFISIPSEHHGMKDAIDHGVELSIAFSQSDSLGHSFVLHASEQFLKGAHSDLIEVANRFSQLLPICYGFCFRRPFNHGPASYGMGMIHNAHWAVDDSNTDRWRDLMAHQAFALLRSIYPQNFLTQMQLDIRMEELRLEDWILADPARGILTRLTDSVSLWTVPEELIRPIRDTLWAAGVILDDKRHFEQPWLQHGYSYDDLAEHYRNGLPLVPRSTKRVVRVGVTG